MADSNALSFLCIGSLGTGFLESSLERGLALDPDFIGADAGSVDGGPNALAGVAPGWPDAAYRRDLDLLMRGAARKMAFTGDYDVTMADWVEGLRVSERFKTQILLPWLTASEGHPLEDTKRSSARAILQLFAPSHPKSPLTKPTFWSTQVKAA